MPENVFIAINADAIHAKSKVYVSRALQRKGADDFDEYQLWASLALELLGKSALASKHSSLIVDPTHWQSMFVAAGISVTTDVKTIAAKTLFERLVHLIPGFDKAVQQFCQDISQRRNAELHSGDLPFKTMKLEAWEARYWHACDTILHHMGSSLEDWLGAADAAAPRQLLDEAANALIAAVKLRIDKAKRYYESLKKSERERLAEEAKLWEPHYHTGLFKNIYDKIWVEDCPACSLPALMTGDQVNEIINEEADSLGVWEIVDREFSGEEFRCPSCDLKLTGSDEINAAGLSKVYEDQQQREMDYEPDYGND